HGSVFFSITPGVFEGARTAVRREGSTISTAQNLSSIHDFGVELGGPILADKLWFYAGVSPSFARYRLDRALNIIRISDGKPVVKDGFTQTDPIHGTEQVFYATQQSVEYLAKLTFLANQDNTISLSVYGSPTWSGGHGTFGINPRDGSVEINNAQSGGIINGTYKALAHSYVSSATDAALKWSSAFQNKHVLLDATVGWHHEENSVRASDGTELGSGRGLSAVSQVFWQRDDPGPHSINDFEPREATRVCEPRGTSNAKRCPATTYFSGGPGALPSAVLDRYQGKVVVTTLVSGFGHHVVKAGADL